MENPRKKTPDEEKIWGDDPAPIEYEEVSPYKDGEKIELSPDYAEPHHSSKFPKPGTPEYDTLPGATDS